MEELYARHVDAIVRLAYLLTGDREVAQDIAQDAFIRAFGRWHHLRNGSAFESYLRTTTVNGARSYFRRRGVERRFLAREAGLRSAHDQPPEVSLRGRLRDELLALPPRQRAAVVLRYFEDLSEDQTAHLLGCSRGNVKALASKGMARLREVLGDDDEQ
ncbi:MAG TPA: SigE family RNA polymerase sigma factor [Actinomycetota bacterium]|nr:SigE family RNA polymerase sigma factor [Actinomycetota bacterium]